MQDINIKIIVVLKVVMIYAQVALNIPIKKKIKNAQVVLKDSLGMIIIIVIAQEVNKRMEKNVKIVLILLNVKHMKEIHAIVKVAWIKII